MIADMPDHNKSTAADQSKQSSSASTTAPPPGEKSHNPVSTDIKLSALSDRIDRTQIFVQNNLDTISENVKKSNDENASQIKSINSALESMLIIIRSLQQKSVDKQEAGTSHDDDEQSQLNRSDFATSAVHLQTNVANAELNVVGNGQFIQPVASRTLHDLPLFSGDPEDWPKFHAMYVQSTAAYGYTSLDNCIRLQKCLKGEAKEAVEFLLLDMNKSADVIEALEFRFGRPELLAQAQLRSVRQISDIPESRPELIVPFASKVANINPRQDNIYQIQNC